MTSQQIKIFDTTLRDGQQCPGAAMSFADNIAYAHLAKKAKVDILEAGFPSANQLDFNIVSTIVNEITDDKQSPIIAALCQLRENQIEMTIRALEGAIPYRKARLHVYFPVDPNLKSALGSYGNNINQILKDMHSFVKHACSLGAEVEISPEGYSRMGENFDFTTDLIRAAVEAGATTINCPDTIGGACHLQGKEYFVEKMNIHASIIENEFPNKKITWSAHCHNDFGLALENTMNSVLKGPVQQIEGCFNGIGERAGNLSLEQAIMYIKSFGSLNKKNSIHTNIDCSYIRTISDFVDKKMLQRQPHWPITGENSAKHSSGGHTNAILKNPLAYQPFNPSVIGSEVTFLFGPFSGGNHAKDIIEKSGYICPEEIKQDAAQYIKNNYSERRKGITDQELVDCYLKYLEPIKDFYFYTNNNITFFEGNFFGSKQKIELTSHEDNSEMSLFLKHVQIKIPDLTIEKMCTTIQSEQVKNYINSTVTLNDGNNNCFSGEGKDKDRTISLLNAITSAVNNAYVYKMYRKK